MSKLKPKIDLIPATHQDYPVIQNMAQFYVYDSSRECGFSMSEKGQYEPSDYKDYFEGSIKKAFLIKVNDELAGFSLLNKIGISKDTDWKIDQFFILAKFQGKGIGKKIAKQIWKTHRGTWEVSVIPKNKSAYVFWRKTISDFTGNKYSEETKVIDYDKHQPKRIIFSFDSSFH